MADIAKAGWLYRQCNLNSLLLSSLFILKKCLASFLKKWKKYWFSLSVEGYLRYFESPDNSVAKKTISIPNDVIAIKTGADVDNKAPDSSSQASMIKLILRENNWILCAEDIDDML